MGNKIIYTDQDGNMCIVTLGKNTKKTEQDIVNQLLGQGFSDAEIVDEALIPADRTFRNAWKKANNTISVDMKKAENILKTLLVQKEQAELTSVFSSDTTDIIQEREDIKNKYKTKVNSIKDVEALNSLKSILESV